MYENENNAMEKIPAINAVDGFDPAALTRTIINDDGSNGLYLDVKYRLLWFRLRFPNGKLDTEVLKVTDQFAIVGCKVYTDKGDAADQYIAKSVAQRFATQDMFGDRFLEVAETAAMGRALASAGFGTQFCSAADIPQEIADAPLDGALPTVNAAGNVYAPEVTQTEEKERTNAMRATTTQAPSVATGNVCGGQMQTPQQSSQNGITGPMTVEDAKRVVVDFGRYKGSTLGQIALLNPGDLLWYINHYNGPNKDVKNGAAVLVNAAQNVAC